MSDMEKMLKDWREGVESSDKDNDHTMDILHEVWTPRWKKFQPPMWRIFRWAYKIKRTLLVDTYPVTVSTSGETINQNPNGSFTLEFQCTKFESPIIDAKAKELLEYIEDTKLLIPNLLKKRNNNQNITEEEITHATISQ